MPGNPLVRFDEGRVGPPQGVALSPTLPSLREIALLSQKSTDSRKDAKAQSSAEKKLQEDMNLVPLRDPYPRYLCRSSVR
jgi:hypothetical protein